MIKKMTLFLFKGGGAYRHLLDRYESLRKAYDALDLYCQHLLIKLDILEQINEELEQDREDCKCKPLAND